jgi:hypothetical protein
MLTAASNTQELAARLKATPPAVQQPVAVAARVSAPAEAKAEAIRKLAQRSRDRRLQPDRAKALERLSPPQAARPAVDADTLQQAAVQAALTALGRG